MMGAMPYPEAYFSARESWRDWHIEANHLISLARVSRDTRVLEIGCGGGGLLRLMRARGARVVGVDTLESALNLSTKRDEWRVASDKETNLSLPVTRHLSLVRIGEERALPFRDGAFDAIVGQHVIEHLPGAEAALDEWKRLLRPDGRLALATPNARYPDPAHFADADHAHVFSPRELCDAVGRAGFAVEACYTIFPFLSRVRALRGLSVLGYRLFQRAPYFSARGRTILVAARKD